MEQRIFSTLSVVTLLALCAGCVESTSEYTINPDGSGKLVYEATFQPINFNMGGEEPAAEKQAREAARAMVEESKGIDTWSDVAFEALDDGRLRVAGTAYFPDVNAVAIKSGATDNEGSEVGFTAEDPGAFTLTYGNQGADEPPPPAGKEVKEVTEADVKKMRMEMQQSLPMLSSFMSGLRSEYTFHLPGTVAEVNNLARNDDGTLGLVIDGEAMLAAMNELVKDDEWLRAQAAGNAAPMEGSPFGSDNKLSEMMLGNPGPIRATGTGATTPLFDYAAATEAARTAFPAMMQSLGIVAPVAVQPADGSGLQDVVVGGIQLVTRSDSESGVRPFNIDNGYNVSLIGQLPGAVLEVSEGMLTRAITDTGADLLPDNEWNRKIHFPSLSERGDQVVFNVEMKLPAPDVTGMEDISGTLTYRVATATKDVDLGITEFSEGATGTELDATIQGLGKSEWNDQIVLKLGLEVAHSAIKEVLFFDAAGNPIEVAGAGSMYSGDSTTLEFGAEDGFPSTGRIVVTIHDDLQEFITPFSVTDIDLLGRPLNP